MTKARRSGRGPLASRQATYSDLMGSWGLWSVGVLGSVYFCESVYLQCYDVELQRSVLVVGLNNLSDLDNLLDRKLVCQSLLVIATKFFDTMVNNNSPRGCGTPFWELMFWELPV
jgi:hypothetical protein